MADLFDYLTWRGDLDFSKDAFNEIDALILSRLSYLPFDEILMEDRNRDGMPLHDAVDLFFEKIKDTEGETYRHIRMPADISLMKALEKSVRFRNAELSGFVNKIDGALEQQFSALTIKLDENAVFVAFRGTDNTLIGWKEDFNMNFIFPIPSQKDGADYLAHAAGKYDCKLYVGGHSKGGNIAVYASAFCDPAIQDRIVNVYNHDGPGFYAETIAEEGYQRIKERVHTYIPQSSVFGMLLEYEEDYTVVKSVNTGLMQHDLYSWQVEGNRFIALEDVTTSSRFFDKTIKDWVFAASPEERERFIDAMYKIFSATDATTIHELKTGWYKYAAVIMRSYRELDEESKKLLKQLFYALAKTAKGNISMMRQAKEEVDKALPEEIN